MSNLFSSSRWIGTPARGRCPARPGGCRRASRWHRLGLEWLEGRWAPATLTVNSTIDAARPTDPYLTLREAISIVNSPILPSGLSQQILAQIQGTLHQGGADRIVFDPNGVTGPIVLGGTQLELSLPGSTAAVTIDGGDAGVTVDGDNVTRIFQVDAGVQATLDHLTITHGWVPVTIAGGIYNQGTLTVASSTLSANSAYSYGGGIYNASRLTVVNSTLSANSANTGGGLYNVGASMLTVTSSTLSSNTAGVNGGGIFNYATLTVTNSTLSANSAQFGSGGGIFNEVFVDYGPVDLQNTIVSGNRAATIGPDIAGPVSSGSSSNLVGSADAALTGISNGQDGNLVGIPASPIDPRLGPLADNGGPTLTQALPDDSPARGAGSLTSAPPTDQRGLPRTVGGEIDIGSFQTQDAVAGPQVVASNPDGGVDPPVDHVRLTFNHPMDPSSVTTDQLSLTGPGGNIAVTGVTAVGSSGGQQFDVSFGPQSAPGTYALVVGTGILDTHGNPPSGPFTARFTVVGTGSTLTVNSTLDTANPSDPYLTLREAIAIVNSPTLPDGLSPEILAQIQGTLHANGSDTIVFDPSQVTTPIVLGGTQLELTLPSRTARVTIDGGDGVTVDANRTSRVLQVDAGAQATLDHLTITHGRILDLEGGGGLQTAGTLTVDNCTLSGNSSFYGGGIANDGGNLTVRGCTLSGNVGDGSGIYNNAGTLTVNSSNLSGNSATDYGGGIYNFNGMAVVTGCTLAGNSVFDYGGGLANYDGTMTVTGCTLSGNSAHGYYGGGIYTVGGSLTVANVTLRGNTAAAGGGIGVERAGTLTVTDCNLATNSANSSGGGIYNYTGTVTVTGSTLSGNIGYSGGGIENSNGALTVTASTLFANSALGSSGYPGDGGGIDNFGGTLTVSSSTLSGNSAGSGGGVFSNGGTGAVTWSTVTANFAGSFGGGGVDAYSGGFSLLNTLVAGNHTAYDGRLGPDVIGAVAGSSRDNLIGIGDPLLTGISNGLNGNLIGSAACPIDPRLGPLADNGGPTFTHALLADSPARGAGSLTSAPPTDQRGLPRSVGGEIDIGSFQTQDAVAGPRLVASNPGGVIDPLVSRARVTFNHPIDPTTFTPDQAALSGPAGLIPLTAVAAVPGTNNQQFDLAFASQTDPGDYALAAGPAVVDVYGNPLDDPTPQLFTVAGAAGYTLTVNSSLDTANDSDPYLTLREAIALVNSPSLPDDLSPEILAQISGPLHSGGADTIAFDTTAVTGPIVLGGRQLELSLPSCIARVTIAGGGVTLDGNNASQVLAVDSGVWAVVDDLTVSHGRVSGTRNGGGLLNAGTLLLTDSTISGCSAYNGGGIDNSNGTLMIAGCTVYGNTVGFSGGGIFTDSGTLTLSNCTLTANSVGRGSGGGLAILGGMTMVTNCTLSGNTAQGGGISVFSPGTLLLRNSIVAGNHQIIRGPDIYGRVDSASSYNLIGIGDVYLTGISNGVNHNRIGAPSAGVAPLGAYGGPTQTFALLPGSPALDAGDPALAGSTDQRGVVRSGGVNIGAFQASATLLVVSAPDSVTAGAPFDVTVAAVDPYGQPAVGYTGTVSFSSGDPYGATLPADYPFTLADAGSHTFVGLTVLHTAGTWDVTATDAVNHLSGSANVNVVAGSAVAFVVTAPSNAVAGTPFDLTVTAMDAFGNVATGYTGTVTFSSSDPDPNVVLPPDYAFQPGDGGMVTFLGGVTLFTPGEQTVTVTDLATGITGTAVITL